MNWARAPLKILDFDTESRPLSYLGQDFTTSEITAIACGWVGKRQVDCWLLGEVTMGEMLAGFVELYDEADMVTGHYIRNHDLPRLNGMLIEAGMPVLNPKLTSDTKNDLIRRQGISAGQGNLAEMLGVQEPKQGMSDPGWRQANRLQPDGMEKARKRVTQDVRQHRLFRARLVELGLLGPPRLWNP